jgi:hypothetical protein
MTRFQSVSVMTAALLGLVFAMPASAQQTAAAKRTVAFAACHKEADSAVPVLRTEQDDMNHYLVFSVCLEKRGYTIGDNNIRGNGDNR